MQTGNLNVATYLDLVENTVDPMITEIAVQVRDFLNERFPLLWIGRRGAIG